VPLDWIADRTGAASARRGARLQRLWRGYGEVRRVHLVGAAVPSVVVKHVRPPPASPGDHDHARKLRSYAVETAWYRDHAGRLPPDVRVPRLFAARERGDERWLVLEDLDAAGFPDRRRDLDDEDMGRTLRWIAGLHATFVGELPPGLWERGTYWHVQTRPAELARMSPGPLRDAAGALDRTLRGARFQTVVHGDAKPANLCFGHAGVAALDFQYVGGGPGIVDVAYLLSCKSPRWRARNTERSLAAYFAELRPRLPAGVDAGALEAEWRELYDVAWADFARFLAGWGRVSLRVPEPDRVRAAIARLG
jgi:hypothetical protein